jgi:hypothetical protein
MSVAPICCDECNALIYESDPVRMYWCRVCADCYMDAWEARREAEARAAGYSTWEAYAVRELGAPR